MTTLFSNISSWNYRDNGNDDDRDPGNGEMGNVSYDSISDENLNNSAGSVSFNNLLTRHAPGLQLEHPDATSPGKYMGRSSKSPQSADSSASVSTSSMSSTLSTGSMVVAVVLTGGATTAAAVLTDLLMGAFLYAPFFVASAGLAVTVLVTTGLSALPPLSAAVDTVSGAATGILAAVTPLPTPSCCSR